MLKILSTVLVSALYLSAALPEGMSFTPYGAAQYRLRYEFLNKEIADVKKSSGNYYNTIAYKIGLKAVLNKQVSAQFEIGNDWGSTEKVDGSNYNYVGIRKAVSPYFSLAFMKWDPGYMHIEAGVIPVQRTSATGLLGVSLRYGNYKIPSHFDWTTYTNGSVQGLKIGAPITKGNFKFGVDLITTIIKQRTESVEDEFNSNNNAVMIMADFPMSIAGFSIIPQFIAIPFRNHLETTNESDHEFMGGIEGNYKLNDAVSLRFGFGFAVFIQNVINDESYTDTVSKKEVGTNGGIGSSMKFGPGKLDIDFRIGSYEDKMLEDNLTIYPFIDLKYGFAVNKHFVIMPRMRLFITDGQTDELTVATRPELIFSGSF